MHIYAQAYAHMFKEDIFITKIFMLYVNFSGFGKHSLTAL